MRKSELDIIHNKIHPKVRLNAICPYFTMFPLLFPYKVLQSAKTTDIVYDPFCGRGTTNYAARLLGLTTFGVDSNPVAHAIAQAKLVRVNPSQVRERSIHILQEYIATDIPRGEFWDFAFHPTTLQHICSIREYLLSQTRLDDVDIALRALLLGILHGPRTKDLSFYLSNQMPRTFASKPDYSVRYWKQRSLLPLEQDVVSLIHRKAEYAFNTQMPGKVNGKIVLADSRHVQNLSRKKFDWVITSPPYFGMATYEQDQWLRNWFLGGPKKVNYSNKTQVNHGSENSFIRDLASVWSNTAQKCRPGALLISRFGALPSKSQRAPASLIKESLHQANSGWKIQTIRTAGRPAAARRQANQFINNTSGYVEEIDVYAILKA